MDRTQLRQEKLALLKRLQEVNALLKERITVILPTTQDLTSNWMKDFFGKIGNYEVQLISKESFINGAVDPESCYCYVEQPTGRMSDAFMAMVNYVMQKTAGRAFVVVISSTSTNTNEWLEMMQTVVKRDQVHFAPLKIFPTVFVDKPEFDKFVQGAMDKM